MSAFVIVLLSLFPAMFIAFCIGLKVAMVIFKKWLKEIAESLKV